MVGIVTASHGVFCEGLKSGTEMVGGATAQYTVVALQPREDPDAYGERLCKAADQTDSGHGVPMLVDPRGGTPLNRSVMLTREKYIMPTAGANPPMLLNVALGRHEDSTLEELATLVGKEAKENIGTICFNGQQKRGCTMESLLLVRIDNRLVHGQVMTVRMKTLSARQIVVIDDRVAKDDFTLFVLQDAVPGGTEVITFAGEEALHKLQSGLDTPSFILAKPSLSLRKLVDGNIETETVSISGMGMKAGRTTVYKNVSATDEERQYIKDLLDRGVDVATQIIPSEKCFELNNVLVK